MTWAELHALAIAHNCGRVIVLHKIPVSVTRFHYMDHTTIITNHLEMNYMHAMITSSHFVLKHHPISLPTVQSHVYS